MISKRTLEKWRREALARKANETFWSLYGNTAPGLTTTYQESLSKILTLTQELLDQHLLRKED